MMMADGTIATNVYADPTPEPMDTDKEKDTTDPEEPVASSPATNSNATSNDVPPGDTVTSINTAVTNTSQTPSTLTSTPDRSAQLAELVSDPLIESLVNSDPAMASMFATLRLRLRLQAQSGTTSTNEDGAADK